MLFSFIRKNNILLLVFISLVLYFFFGYFLERTQFNSMLFLWAFLFICFYFLLNNKKINFNSLASIALLFRLAFLFTIPNLSQDFYRFIWDGRMILEGFNPYLSLPEVFIEQRNYPINEAVELYNGMGKMNGSHYTNYPPINQFCFFIAAIFSNKSILGAVIIMRSLIILADIGILYYGKKLLELLNLPSKNIFLYLLNPFIIIELTGNLHFEPVMLFFLIFSLYKLKQEKWILASILLACSVSVKLIPLLFLPIFYQWFTGLNQVNDLNKINKKFIFPIPNFSNFTKLISFYLIILSSILLLFLPFYSSELISNYSNSVGLWFRSFEFNASFYYLAREIGYLFRGYNEIAIIGKIIPIVAILFLIVISLFRNNRNIKSLITAMLFGLSFYYFLSTTVHPWYLATLLILSVFTNYRFPIIWSLVIIITYQAYANNPWKENLWFVAIEYLVVYGYLTWELFYKSHRIKAL
ncbi:mannosyltransferase [Tenacibaculum sp.]|nr:mannosyltransferase [Tenacibaculum sp.]